MKKLDFKGEILDIGTNAKTVEEASSAIKVKLKYIVKSILLMADDRPFIFVLSGEDRLDLEKVKNLLNVKKIRFASNDEVLKYTGYLPGTIPPICHKISIPIIVDKKVLRYEFVYGGGGSFRYLLKFKTWDLHKLEHVKVKNVSK